MSDHEAAPRRRRQRVLALSALFAIATGTTTWAVTSLATGTHAFSAGSGSAAPAPRAAIGDAISAGPAHPTFTIDITTAFGCADCVNTLRTLHDPLAAARDAYLAHVSVHLRPGAGAAADVAQNAIACASDRSADKAVTYALDLLSAGPQAPTPPQVAAVAARDGITGPAFSRCVEHATYLPWLRHNPAAPPLRDARVLVNGHPTDAATLIRILSAPAIP